MMPSKQETLSFKSSEKLSSWLEKALETLKIQGQPANRSDVLRSKMEAAITIREDYFSTYYELSGKTGETLSDIYQKVILEGEFLSHREAYFLLVKAHEAYLNYQGSYFDSVCLAGLLTVFQGIIEEARREGWKPVSEDRYLLSNLRGDSDHTADLYSQILQKTQNTLAIVSESAYYGGGAEIHARDAEVILPTIDISLEGLNRAFGSNIAIIFSLAVMAYQLSGEKETSFYFDIPTNNRLEALHKHYTNKGVSLSIIEAEGRALGKLHFETQGVEIGANWSGLLDWKRLFIGGVRSIPKVKLYKYTDRDRWVMEFHNSGIHLSLSREQVDAATEVLRQFFSDPETQQVIERSKLLYGNI